MGAAVLPEAVFVAPPNSPPPVLVVLVAVPAALPNRPPPVPVVPAAAAAGFAAGCPNNPPVVGVASVAFVEVEPPPSGWPNSPPPVPVVDPLPAAGVVAAAGASGFLAKKLGPPKRFPPAGAGAGVVPVAPAAVLLVVLPNREGAGAGVAEKS